MEEVIADELVYTFDSEGNQW